VILPTLTDLDIRDSGAAALLLATAIHESGLGFAIPPCRQGHGMYQISAEVHQDVWDNYLSYDPDLASRVRGLASQRHFLTDPHRELTTNLAYATAIAWFVYKHYGLAMVETMVVEELAQFWQQHFPSIQKGSMTGFVKSYKHYTEAVVAA
jgi:hypothetical protein